MTNDYNIKVLTNKDLGDPIFVTKLLNSWCYELDSRLTPEFFGLGEPVRHSFAKEGVDAAISNWVEEGMGLLLRRRGEFGYLATIEWWRRDTTLDERLFPWSCEVYLRRKAGDALALKYLRFLIKWFEPGFGYLSTHTQVDENHFITINEPTGTTEMYEGLDIIKEEEKLPGIYWTTYFGPWSVEKIGKARFLDIGSELIEGVNDGYLVQAYRSSSEIGRHEAIQVEHNIKRKLGNKHFFDKSLVDIQALKESPEEDDEIERMVEEVKRREKPKKLKS